MKIEILRQIVNALNDSDVLTGYAAWFASPDFMSRIILVMAAFKFMSVLWGLGQKP